MAQEHKITKEVFFQNQELIFKKFASFNPQKIFKQIKQQEDPEFVDIVLMNNLERIEKYQDKWPLLW